MPLPNLAPAQVERLLATSETLHIPLAEGIQARVQIEIIVDGPPSPNERPARRCPSPRELHHTADALLRRVYQFHPID